MVKIALIACVKEKREKKCIAQEMYLGDDFTGWIADAEKREVDYLYILSGKYGLLSPDELIEPYDVNLNQVTEKERKEWADEVIRDLKNLHDLQKDHFILYTNKHYYHNLITKMKHFEIPFPIE